MKKRTIRKTKEFLSKLMHDRIFLAISAILLFSIWGLIVYGIYFGSVKGVIAEVGNEKIYQKDLNEQIYGRFFKGSVDNPEKISKEEREVLLNGLIEQKIIQIEAANQRILVSDNEINERAVREIADWADYTDEQKNITRKNFKTIILTEKIKERILGYREGSYALFHIDRYLESELGTDKEQKEKEDQGREARINEEKEYALNLADSLHKQIVEGKISFEDAMNMADKDQKIGADSFLPRNVLRGGNFTKENWENQHLITGFEDFRKNAMNTKVNEISKPFTVKVILQDGSLKEGLVAIVKNEKGSDGSYSTLEEWIENKKEELKIKKYILGSFIKIAYADDTGNTVSSKWGIQSGTNAATAGFIVYTRIKYLDGSYSPLNGIDIKITAKNGSGPAFYYKYDASAGTIKTFSTGSPIYTGPVNSDNHAHANGYLVLGYGDSNSHGNRYSLDCDWQFEAEPRDTAAQVLNSVGLSPANYSGYWDPTLVDLSISNGVNYWETFTFVITQNPPPQQQNPSLTVRAENSSGTSIPVAISANPANFSGTTVYTKTGSAGQQIILSAPPSINYNSIVYNFSGWVLSGGTNLGTLGSQITLGLPNGNGSATAKAIYASSTPAAGSCSILLDPNRGSVPLRTAIMVNNSLPPDGYDHSHCACQYCACPYDVNYYWRHDNYRVYYQQYDQSNNLVGPEINIFSGNGTPSAPAKYDFTFNNPLNIGNYYVVKSQHRLRKYTYDGHSPSTNPTTMTLECGNSSVSAVFPRKWEDMDWWEVAP